MELEQFVIKFASQFEDVEIENIHGEVVFKSLETWDSLTAFSIQMMIEDEYEVVITPQELKEVGTVSELYELVKSRSPK